MNIRFRWKLMGSYLLLVLLMGGVLYTYLNHTLGEYLMAEIRGNLLNQAHLARLLAARDDKRRPETAEALATSIGREIKARVTIISPDGVVLGDSDMTLAKLPGMENHLNRPEVRQALETGEGSAIRYSETVRMPMLYVAVRLETGPGETGVIRLALPLALLTETSVRLHTMLGAALLLMLLMALVLSYLLSRLITRPLHLITEAVGRVGSGEFDRRIPVTSGDELGELARVMNEMTERIGSQVERLSTERNRLDTILRSMGEGLMVTNGSGIITLVNPAFRTLFALDGNVEGKSLLHIARQPGLYETFRKVVASAGEETVELTLRLPEEKDLATHWVPLCDNGELKGVVAVFHNISAIRRLEKVRRDFVANVSHELRTPVTVIKGYAETLTTGTTAADPEVRDRFLGIIRNHAERLSCLIGDLLALSEMESGGFTLRLVPVDTEGAIAHACDLVADAALVKEIRIDCPQAAGTPRVLADPGRLEQVLVNLLDNAIKYSPQRSTITVTAREAGALVSISVADTGIGIPEKDLPRIFERFYRVDAARSRDLGGTGLGLAIVKHIAQLQGGTVQVQSIPGKGATFTFTLKKVFDSVSC